MNEKSVALVIGLAFFAALVAGPAASFAQKAEVKAYEAYEQIDEHNQLPLNPHPPFGLLTGYICYPNCVPSDVVDRSAVLSQPAPVQAVVL